MSTFSLNSAPAPLALPVAPASLTGPVKAWLEHVTLPTFEPATLSKHPVFADEKSRGSGYPSAVPERNSQSLASHSWEAIHLENEFLRLMILPALGGRIHLAVDKTSGQEFLYRDDTIDTSGSRVQGGLEVNWPSDPRPNPLTLIATHIEEHSDGARTVWCSAYDPLTRLKGMHGFCLYPGRAYLELKARLFNRTSFSHSFNWSARAAVLVPNELKNCSPDLTKAGIFEEISAGFFAFYCSSTELGLLQVAEQSSSGGHSFTRYPEYGEMRAGMYSGFPPGESFIAPAETKSFSQFWYPFTKIGPPQKANVDAAVSFSVGERNSIGVSVTRTFPNAVVLLETEGTVLSRWARDLAPGQPLLEETSLPPGIEADNVTVKVLTSAGRELIAYTPGITPDSSIESSIGEAATTEIFPPRKVATLEALYLTGLRVHHDSAVPYKAEEYWREALRREPSHALSNNALGLLQLHRGEFGEAEAHFRKAIATVTSAGQAGTAADGEFFYNLGLTLRFQERDEEAYAAFQRAAWSFAWRAPALHSAAELECKRGNFGIVPKLLYEALRLNADNNNARSLAVVLFRRFGRAAEAEQLVRESLTLDPLDPWACHLAGRAFPGDNQIRMDLAFDYARAGLYDSAIELLTGADTFATDGSLPMIRYTLAAFYMRAGDFHAAQREFLAAAASQPTYCFPHRLEEMMVLARAIALQPEDARAQYYLGCLLYHYGLPLQAMEIWQSSAKLDPKFPIVWRNLAIGHYNVTRDNEKALDAFDQACLADPADSHLFYERDQLWKRLGVPPTLRFQDLVEQKELADQRVDLALELATLYNTNGESENALALFSSGKLKGWEQNPDAVEQYVRTYVKLGRKALADGDPERARDLFLSSLSTVAGSSNETGIVPQSAELHFWLGEAMNATGHHTAAQTYWQKATAKFNTAPTRPIYTQETFFIALSLGRIGDRQQSRRLLRELWFAGRRIAREKSPRTVTISSFNSDEPKLQRLRGLLLQSQARVGLGQYKLAARLLEQLLTLDPNNGRALDLISDLELATQT